MPKKKPGEFVVFLVAYAFLNDFFRKLNFKWKHETSFKYNSEFWPNLTIKLETNYGSLLKVFSPISSL